MKDGINIRDYVHVEDLVTAHILALQCAIKANECGVFSLGTAHAYSNFKIV